MIHESHEMALNERLAGAVGDCNGIMILQKEPVF